MFTLKALRDRLRLKANQSEAVGSSLSWSNDEINGYIKAAVSTIIDAGRDELISNSSRVRVSITASGNGIFLKPSNYYRFVNAIIDNVPILEITNISMLSMIENNSLLKGNTGIKYIYDYSGTEFLVYPTSATTMNLLYVKQLLTTDFDDDNDVSPLTNIGDEYALDYAFAMVLESKLFKPDIAQSIFRRVAGQIK